ncbi:NAD-dependent epimerase/dehydratase family protein [Hydrogenophaga crassostreae]|uniref:NAD-dependent epimerase/dehydratase domain-containing protein n=1 Tax=Hydrogenophaga crassostreae TaxID=1763535 RepID=A0A1D8NSE8_9BURK|nr:NAD-dependent epimerase/dehydratase family protein [Hydrogenophaga crassostreae]AOW12039.1 hypothetical protein LPB072_03410 [Hydrogenophaga crassostreae]
MHVVVTGAAGFVGRALTQRLISDRALCGQRIDQITLMDLAFEDAAPGGVRQLPGDIGDTAWLASALGAQTVDAVFHLASIPGGAAEQNYGQAKRVNLDATQTLLELGQRQVQQAGKRPVFVFASSIAVFGAMPETVTDDTLPHPQMTYGAQKLVGEVLVNDFSRRGWVDGLSLRLPGVLARPPAPTGQLSAFLSDIIRELAAHRPFVCPMAPEVTTWASSLPNVIDNLVHAASKSGTALEGQRTFTLPTLRYSMSELVDAMAEVHGERVRALVRFEPQERMEALFGRFPVLETPAAIKAGFVADENLTTLVRRALIA